MSGDPRDAAWLQQLRAEGGSLVYDFAGRAALITLPEDADVPEMTDVVSLVERLDGGCLRVVVVAGADIRASYQRPILLERVRVPWDDDANAVRH